MKLFLVTNPYAFIGYFIVKASDEGEAVQKVDQKLRNMFNFKSSEKVRTGYAEEILFDIDGVNDSITGLE